MSTIAKAAVAIYDHYVETEFTPNAESDLEHLNSVRQEFEWRVCVEDLMEIRSPGGLARKARSLLRSGYEYRASHDCVYIKEEEDREVFIEDSGEEYDSIDWISGAACVGCDAAHHLISFGQLLFPLAQGRKKKSK